MVSQLRMYTINKGRMEDFVQAWTAGVYPLRLKQGYRIERADVIEETNQFVWILSYDGLDDWDAKEAAYYSSPDRALIDPDPRQYIARGEKWFIKSVLPS